MFDKFVMNIPLNRQSDRFFWEGIHLPVSTLVDQVGHVMNALMPLHDLIVQHVFEGKRIHADDTTLRIRAKGQCITGRIWLFGRVDSPFGGRDAPAVVFYGTRDRRGEHPRRYLASWGGGILQADCYSGFNAIFV